MISKNEHLGGIKTKRVTIWLDMRIEMDEAESVVGSDSVCGACDWMDR